MPLATGIGPLGRSLKTTREHEIIGAVADVKNTALQAANEPALYHTQRQFPFRSMFVVVRGDDPGRLAAAVKETVSKAIRDCRLPMSGPWTTCSARPWISLAS